MHDDEYDSTWDRVRRGFHRTRYEGEEKRSPPSFDFIRWLPLALACLSGVYGYATLTADVRTLQRDMSNLEQVHRDWNKSISDRVRDLERQ
jgi:hypothetical protein